MEIKMRDVNQTTTLRLVELSYDMEDHFMDFYRSLGSKEVQDRWLFEYKGEPFKALVDKLQDCKHGRQLRDDWVPCSTFYLVRQDGKIVGKSSLRHELNDFLRKIGGHIGYVIRPDECQKGCGTMILKLTLEKARELGLKKVLVTCDSDNIASAKIIEKNGGILEGTYQNAELPVPKRRYWIDLKG